MKKILICFGLILGFVMSIFAGQCQGITKKGKQCKRNAPFGSEYCWQHKEQSKNTDSGETKKSTVVRNQCKATTRAGTQCKRSAETGGEYCWRHKKITAESKTESVQSNLIEKDAVKTQGATESSATTGKCQGKTKKGKPCSRKAQQGSNFCWQHQE